MRAGQNVIVRGDVLRLAESLGASVVMTRHRGGGRPQFAVAHAADPDDDRATADHHLGVVALVVTGCDSRSNTS